MEFLEFLNETNKEDLRRRNRELRHRQSILQQRQKQRENERKSQAELKKQQEANKPQNKYPDLVLTLLKRLRRIDPWHGAAGMKPHQSALVCYFKLKQFGIDELKIGANNIHAWTEFLYDGSWFIFDPIAVRNRKLGSPIKQSVEATEVQYNVLTRYFNSVDSYLESYGQQLKLSRDECKIAAMEDEGLSSIMRSVNYH